jgi:hypothetical protein
MIMMAQVGWREGLAGFFALVAFLAGEGAAAASDIFYFLKVSTLEQKKI